MMHKAWHSIEEVPYYLLRSSIRFQRPVAAIKSLWFALFVELWVIPTSVRLSCLWQPQSPAKNENEGMERLSWFQVLLITPITYKEWVSQLLHRPFFLPTAVADVLATSISFYVLCIQISYSSYYTIISKRFRDRLGCCVIRDGDMWTSHDDSILWFHSVRMRQKWMECCQTDPSICQNCSSIISSVTHIVICTPQPRLTS